MAGRLRLVSGGVLFLVSLLALRFGVDEQLGRLLDLVTVAAEVLRALVRAAVLVLERPVLVLAHYGDACVVGRELGVRGAHVEDGVVPHLLLGVVQALRVQVFIELDQLLLGRAQLVKNVFFRLVRDDRGRHVALGLLNG